MFKRPKSTKEILGRRELARTTAEVIFNFVTEEITREVAIYKISRRMLRRENQRNHKVRQHIMAEVIMANKHRQEHTLSKISLIPAGQESKSSSSSDVEEFSESEQESLDVTERVRFSRRSTYRPDLVKVATANIRRTGFGRKQSLKQERKQSRPEMKQDDSVPRITIDYEDSLDERMRPDFDQVQGGISEPEMNSDMSEQQNTESNQSESNASTSESLLTGTTTESSTKNGEVRKKLNKK